MAVLTQEQISFLKSQRIAPTQLFDASSSGSKAEIQEAMSNGGFAFYYGGAQCKKGEHTLRTKSGHCIQCDTSKIAYQLRHSSKGTVYLAYSKSRNLVKVGVTGEKATVRIESLRAQSYGNADDWELKRSTKLEKDAGKKEFRIHSDLETYQHPVEYKRSNGLIVECRELYSCELKTALQVYDEILRS